MAGEDEKPPAPGHEATVVIPGSVPGGSLSGTAVPQQPTTSPGIAGAVTSGYRPIQPGDVLNHIFEVKRFIARGGMGEVFEGINVNSDERVAIKVILPQLAADPAVQAMFRKEARTLTRLGHPALVQYRVLAQEPSFGVLYIVTEYVDGANLSDVIAKIEATPQDLIALIRRLAEGLQSAHALGAIHRDMSPDNILLEGGELAKARIIDFGIAKDLDPGSSTIIGDGFAGKLNYVAPEQLGDFGREVGPWTDVYSLALVILAIIRRRDVDMGRSMVEAVDKRRAGPDLSAAPEELRPLLARMLAPDPKQRIRSMGDLLAELPIEKTKREPPEAMPAIPPPAASHEPEVEPAEPEAEPAEPEPIVAATAHEPTGDEPPPPVPPPAAVAEPSPAPAAPTPAPAKSSKTPLLAGAGAVVLLALAGMGYAILGKGGADKDETRVVAIGDLTGPTRAALAAALPSVGCTWLDVADVRQQGAGTEVALRGVAGRPAEAQRQIAQALAGKDLKNTKFDLRDVATIEASECGPLDALRQIRDPAGMHMRVEQPQLEMAKMTAGNLAGKVGATAALDFDFSDFGANPGQEAALFGVQPSGKISLLTAERAELVGAGTATGPDRYRLTIDVDHPGWSGLLLLTGRKPFDSGLLAGEPGSRTGDWSQRFLAAAKERGWKAEMAWFNAVDATPN